jgi:hypothetical protein
MLMIGFVRARKRGVGIALAVILGLAIAVALVRHASSVQHALEAQLPSALMPEAMFAKASAPMPRVATESAGMPLALGQDIPHPAQLIRTATIDIRVSDVSKQLRTAADIAASQGGDVVNLSDEVPDSATQAHRATAVLRVPQDRFDPTLALLGALGHVTSQSIDAQDVSDQLVDMGARLRNLRRTEADILAIMDRSGNIEQVLEVTQQLSDVRDQIERLDAQLAATKHQVAYSTITLTLHSPPVLVAPSSRGILLDAWRSAIASVRDVTLALLAFGLWLAAFSPYLALIALGGYLLVRRLRGRPAV